MTVKVIVYHDWFGCDTGCCGHTVELEGDGREFSKFDFAHPYDNDFRAFAEDLVRKELGEEHVKDLDWANCIISVD